MTLEEFVRKKMDVACALDRRQCGGSYAEACMIVAAIISGLAADLWPGDGIDRKRFVELWVRYGQTIPTAAHVSMPLLTQWLDGESRRAEARAIENSRPEMFGAGFSSRVVTGSEVDMPEDEVLSVCGTVTRAEIRPFTYPAIFYKEFRCGLMHEYRFGDRASDWSMTMNRGQVSYFNMADGFDGTRRLIHFDLPWLRDLVLSIARASEPDTRKAPLPLPSSWWLASA